MGGDGVQGHELRVEPEVICGPLSLTTSRIEWPTRSQPVNRNRAAERERVKREHDFDVNVLALRSPAELLGDVHNQTNQQNLRRRIDDLLGADPERQA